MNKSEYNLNMDLSNITSPIILEGNHEVAYRDPAVHFYNGVFRIFFTHCVKEKGLLVLCIAVIESTDLVNWSKPEVITAKDSKLNYSSPGNIIRYKDKWLMCLQTYPITKAGQEWGDDSARIFIMTSSDLINWSKPEILMVKGIQTPVSEMGRMIDPFIVQDLKEKDKWWCFYKQKGASISYTYDFKNWEYFGNVNAGENACVISEEDEYILIHSPKNGIGIKKSKDMLKWEDAGLYVLGQEAWEWAQGRITAGFILDMREHPQIGNYLLFFHGSTVKDLPETHGAASIGIAWSKDLHNWEWPNKNSNGYNRSESI